MSLPLLLLPVLLLAAVVAATTALAQRSAPSAETSVAAARRHARITSTAAIVLGVAAGVWVAVTGLGTTSPGGAGITALLVPIAVALVHTVVVGIGELTWPRPDGEVRRARLVRRGPLDAAPRWLTRVAGGAAAAAAVTVIAGAVLAAPDGRSYTAVLVAGALDGEGRRTSTASPFPGLFYGGPAGLGLLLLAAATLTALWIVATRPAVATRDERIETALRRASAHRVLRAGTAAVLVDTGGLLFIGGMAARIGPGVVPLLGGAVAVLGVLAILAGVAVLCTRAPGVPADAPAVRIG
jgi:hypothetical protein